MDISIDDPYIEVEFYINGNKEKKQTLVDSGSGLGVKIPDRYKEWIIPDERTILIEKIERGEIFKMRVTLGDGSSHMALCTTGEVKINNDVFDTIIVCMGNTFSLGRAVMKQAGASIIFKGNAVKVMIKDC